MDDPLQVDVDDAVPMGKGELRHLAAHADARVVEQQVDAAVFADDPLHELVERLGVADVEGGRLRRQAGCAPRPYSGPP